MGPAELAQQTSRFDNKKNMKLYIVSKQPPNLLCVVQGSNLMVFIGGGGVGGVTRFCHRIPNLVVCCITGLINNVKIKFMVLLW